MKADQPRARTQIYLTQAQHARLRQARKVTATTQSKLIRRAIDQFLDQQGQATPQEKARRLQDVAGLWDQRDDMVDPVAYVGQLRAPRF